MASETILDGTWMPPPKGAANVLLILTDDVGEEARKLAAIRE
jgi:hypothetical protein